MRKILVSLLILQSAACVPECKPPGQLDPVDVSVDGDVSTDGTVGAPTENSFTLATAQGEIAVSLPLVQSDAIDAGAEVAVVKRRSSFTLSDDAGLVLEILATGIAPDFGDEGGTTAVPAGEHAAVADSPARDLCTDEKGQQESIPVQFAGRDFYTGTNEVLAVDDVNYRVRVLESVREEFEIAGETIVDRQVRAFVVRQR